MLSLYSTIDPRGYNVVCHDSTINHIDNHQIMVDNHEAIKQTISDPDTIFKSAEYNDREVYFAKPPCATYSENNLFTKVIVHLDDIKMTGEVVTAFPTKHIEGNIVEGGVTYVKPRLR